jgi:DNA-binding NarL/FixJ family response regulator
MLGQRWLSILGYGALAASVLASLYLISLAPIALDWGRELVGAAIAVTAMVIGVRLARRENPEAPNPSVGQDNGKAGVSTPSGDAELLLSQREREVLELLCRGMSNKLMARDLNVSENTIKTHVANLYAKLDVSRRTEAQAKAYRMGLIASGRSGS